MARKMKKVLNLAGIRKSHGLVFNAGEEAAVKVELTPELKNQFVELGKSVNTVKSEALNAVDGMKNELNGKLTAQDKKIDKIEESMNLISIRANNAVKEDPKRGFKNHVEFFNAVIVAGMNGMRPDKMPENLKSLFNAVGSDEARLSSNPAGGFIVPPAFMPGLMTTDSKETQIDTGALTRPIPMSSPVLYINARVDKNHASSVSGGFQVYRRAETETVTASKAAFEQVKMEANALMGISFASEEILTLSPVSFAALIQSGFGDEKISKGNYERIWGSGVGEFLGIQNSPALVTVAKESGQAADTINGKNLVKMRSRCWGYRNAVWMANQDCLDALTGCHIAGTNGDVFLFSPGNGTDKPDTIMGRPVIFDENCATLGDLGDLMLVNWKECLEGTLGGTSFEESIHVRFVYNERAFRFTVYNDCQPWWKTPMTPKKSAVTLSPFVTLQAR
jgi:HK97 family phage major capsid protein